MCGGLIVAVGLFSLPTRTRTACLFGPVSHYWKAEGLAGDGFRSPEDALQTGADAVMDLRPTDLAIAFSGGGTRSASATMGELRALSANHWLDRVKYLSAVSGGAWASIPFEYLNPELADAQFLGSLEPPGEITVGGLKQKPAGSLTKAIAESHLLSSSLLEVGRLGGPAIFRQQLDSLSQTVRRFAGDTVAGFIDGVAHPRVDQTYAQLMGRWFVDPFVRSGTKRFYSWNHDTVSQIIATNQGLLTREDFVTVRKDRPFLIVGGAILQRPIASRLVALPIEFTPVSTGVRHRFGGIGGTHVWPWAYDVQGARYESATALDLVVDPSARRFTLSDLMAVTGSAPEFLFANVDALNRADAVFPILNRVDVTDRQSVSFSPALQHADGGAVDNVGLMPLLARHVHNILAFLNTESIDYATNSDIYSYFEPESDKPASQNDQSMNVVFPAQAYGALIRQFDRLVERQQPLVACQHLRVLPNSNYEIDGEDAVNICWIYN